MGWAKTNSLFSMYSELRKKVKPSNWQGSSNRRIRFPGKTKHLKEELVSIDMFFNFIFVHFNNIYQIKYILQSVCKCIIHFCFYVRIRSKRAKKVVLKNGEQGQPSQYVCTSGSLFQETLKGQSNFYDCFRNVAGNCFPNT